MRPLWSSNLRQHANVRRGLIQLAKRKHLACLVDRYGAALIYNHRAIGKHPAVRFGSLSCYVRTPAQAGRASTSARLYSNGRAVVGEPQGSPA